MKHFFGFARKRRVRINFMVRKVYTTKMSGPYQLFYGSGPILFCSVNGVLNTGRNCGFGNMSA